MTQRDLRFPLDSWLSTTKTSREPLLFKQNGYSFNSKLNSKFWLLRFSYQQHDKEQPLSPRQETEIWRHISREKNLHETQSVCGTMSPDPPALLGTDLMFWHNDGSRAFQFYGHGMSIFSCTNVFLKQSETEFAICFLTHLWCLG